MNNQSLEFEKLELEFDIRDQKVSHLLHLVLSLVTCGLWLIVWLIVVLSSYIEIKRLKAKLSEIYDKLTD